MTLKMRYIKWQGSYLHHFCANKQKYKKSRLKYNIIFLPLVASLVNWQLHLLVILFRNWDAQTRQKKKKSLLSYKSYVIR